MPDDGYRRGRSGSKEDAVDDYGDVGEGHNIRGDASAMAELSSYYEIIYISYPLSFIFALSLLSEIITLTCQINVCRRPRILNVN